LQLCNLRLLQRLNFGPVITAKKSEQTAHSHS